MLVRTQNGTAADAGGEMPAGLVVSGEKKEEPETAEEKKNLSATGIVRFAQSLPVKLFHSPDRDPFVSFWIRDHWENWPIKSAEFEDWLAANCFHHLGAVPSQRALADAKCTLSGHARYASPENQVFVRLAEHGGAIYLDLGTESWELVRITSEGWEVVGCAPIKFVRPSGMRQLPHPLDGGNIGDLRPFLNLRGEDDFRLAVAWLVGALRPTGPFPLLVMGGTHGSAKSTVSRLLRALIDPNAAPLRAAPRNPRDLAISAKNSWCLGFDNLSSVESWLSDALCRISTGSGFATRTLYTDSREMIFDGMRPVLANGIELDIGRPDLLDRGIFLSLPPIAAGRRETEATVWARFEDRRPYIFGSLLDAAACALRRLREITLLRTPRMADFATWVSAAEPALGWPTGSFLEAYERNRQEANTLALESSSLVQPIIRLAERGLWQGTATELLNALNAEVLHGPVGEQWSYPRNPNELSHVLRRLVPNLSQIGISVDFRKTPGNNSARMITIEESGHGATDSAG